MKIEIDVRKSIDENAGRYFEIAKKSKKKIEGAQDALKNSKEKLAKLLQQEETFQEEEKKKEERKSRKQEWYEKFHWFISSEGFICFGGKDATSNEIVIKKHLEKNDLVFHTESPGSPFFIIQNGQESGEITRNECAIATACYSRAWREGHTSAEIFYIKPNQVTKEAQPGEVVAKGSFMIYGKRTILQVKLEYAIGIINTEIISGPISAVKDKTDTFVVLIPGRSKKGEMGKKIKAKFKDGNLDDIMTFLPGNSAIGK
jgi:predicted ribosome quality control (RQC) complex YloA/Tae2 family protein